MSPRYLTVDNAGNIYRITHLFDVHARETNDPGLADYVVIEGACGRTVSAPTEDAPVYTEH